MNVEYQICDELWISNIRYQISNELYIPLVRFIWWIQWVSVKLACVWWLHQVDCSSKLGHAWVGWLVSCARIMMSCEWACVYSHNKGGGGREHHPMAADMSTRQRGDEWTRLRRLWWDDHASKDAGPHLNWSHLNPPSSLWTIPNIRTTAWQDIVLVQTSRNVHICRHCNLFVLRVR